jgi:hypothetical protein
MSQGATVLPTTGTISGLQEQNYINAAVAALLSINSGGSAPTSPTAGMLWWDTATGWIQEYDGTDWNNLFYLDTTNHLGYAQLCGGAVAILASAATVDLWSTPGSVVEITGAATITALCASDAAPGTLKVAYFTGALTLTHNSSSLILPNNGANITTAAGDTALVMAISNVNVLVVQYVRANGRTVSTYGVSGPSSATSGDLASFNGTAGNVIQDSGVPATDVARLSVADQTVAGGANVTSYNLGVISSGTGTVDCGKAPLQYVTNNGAFTIAAPANDGSCILLVSNGASAGAITFSGFTVGASTGASLTTTNGNKFSISIWRVNGVSGYSIFAHQ